MSKTRSKKTPTRKIEPCTILMLVILLAIIARLVTLFAGWLK